MFRFAGSVDHAAHDGQLEFLDAGILLVPLRHRCAQIALYLLGQFLEIGAGGASAAGATRHLRHEAANPQRLQNLLRGQHLLGPVPVRRRRQRRANRVADAFLQQD